MTLIKNVCASDVLADVALATEDKSLKVKIENLLNTLKEQDKVKDFEWYIENEFPHGTDEDELVSFCTDHTIKYILNSMKN